jgi:hypothetical protein
MGETAQATAAQLLDAAERQDGYRAACAASFSNAAARRRCTYRAAMVGPKDADRLLAAVDSVPLLADATVVVMHHTAEGGYPHTRPGGLVCMPTRTIEGVSDATLLTTLRHEAVHLHQRAEPVAWLALCRREGWEPVAAAAVPARLRGRVRLNPDTFWGAAGASHQFWAWEGRTTPLPLFSTEQPSSIGDVVVKWLDTRSEQLVSSAPPSFQARYGSGGGGAPSQPEHPFELLAVEAADAGIGSKEALVSKLFYE